MFTGCVFVLVFRLFSFLFVFVFDFFFTLVEGGGSNRFLHLHCGFKKKSNTKQRNFWIE